MASKSTLPDSDRQYSGQNRSVFPIPFEYFCDIIIKI